MENHVEDSRILIYEKSVSGRSGRALPGTKSSEEEIIASIPEELRRTEDAMFPEVSEPEVVRHYTNLSTKNHHIDKGFYPLGSCTMKYNPKRNDVVASLPSFLNHHPLMPHEFSEGCVRLMWELSATLSEVSGFPHVSLQPVAGAHGEFVGLLMMRAFHNANGEERTKIIIPDSAHGTNPSSVSSLGWTTVQIKSNENGIISPEVVEEVMATDVAGIMLTNPNTLGLFESEIVRISEIVHAKGGLLYMDGANLNANMGIFRPGDIGFDLMHFNLHKTFSTPHGGGGPGAGAVGVTNQLAKFLPSPVVVKSSDGKFSLDYDRADSIGQVHSFFGNFANMVRAYAYIRSLGGKGLRRASENAIINANYLKALLKIEYDLPHEQHCMHEFVISGNRQKKLGVRTSDISKRLLDFGVHAPTNYFPLIVPEAMMIEPTETETVETLDRFAAIMNQIAEEVEQTPEIVKSAPTTTPVRRLNEAAAARSLDVAYLD